MGENYIHIDNIVEDRVSRPGEIGIGANIQTKLDGASKFAIISILSSLLNDLGIEPLDISAYRKNIEENVVRSDRTKIEVEELRKSLERFRRLKAEMEGDA